jgi:hypothetical protein
MADELTLEEKKLWLRELKEARYTGARRVQFRDRDVTYKSDAEMRDAIRDLEAEISASSGRGRKHIGLVTFGRGL